MQYIGQVLIGKIIDFDPSCPPIPVSLKKHTNKSLITNGNIFDGDTAEEVFNSEAGDFVAIGDLFLLILIGFILSHPDFPTIG